MVMQNRQGVLIADLLHHSFVNRVQLVEVAIYLLNTNIGKMIL